MKEKCYDVGFRETEFCHFLTSAIITSYGLLFEKNRISIFVWIGPFTSRMPIFKQNHRENDARTVLQCKCFKRGKTHCFNDPEELIWRQKMFY